MKLYDVRLPICGELSVQVEANSEEDAIEKALGSDLSFDMIETWEAHRMIVEGNIFHGSLREAKASLAAGEEPDEPEVL